MISEINREDFLSALYKKRGFAPEKIKAFTALENPDTKTFKSGNSIILISGNEALIFGSDYKKAELLTFFKFSGIKSVGGNIKKLGLVMKSLAVLAARGTKEEEPKNADIFSSARLFSSVFGVDFQFLYPDLCFKINHKKGFINAHENGSCFVHTSPFGALLTAVAVEETARGKGEGERLVKSVLNCFDGTVFVISEKNLLGFYQKCGFKFLSETNEAEL
jgi:GNAT superfamily N-acetyltransferase